LYRLTPEPPAASEPQPAAADAARAQAAAPAAAAQARPPPPAREAEPDAPSDRPAPAAAEARTVAVGAAALDAAAEPAPPPGRSAARRYLDALALLQSREYAKADETLTEAIAIDPRLAHAHAARASARFGLGRFRDAATDYRTALELDAGLGTPLYGLAECYRVLGDARRASEMYERYAQSGAADVRADLREIASKRAQELR
jgi:tetratricopeptide (TPR) repeat protein